eukprot:SAG31_NODE_6633_length_1943_cov_3.928959_1_plen_179_part_00
MVSMKAFSFTTILVLGGGACAALAAAIIAAAVTADESTSVGMGAFCLLSPGGPGACAVLPTNAGYGSELYMLQTDVLSMANRTGGAAVRTAAAPGSPHGDLYMCCDLQRGSGGEKQIGILPFAGALGRALAQPFSFLGSLIRYGSALPCLRRRRRWQDSVSCSPPTIAAFTFMAAEFC